MYRVYQEFFKCKIYNVKKSELELYIESENQISIYITMRISSPEAMIELWKDMSQKARYILLYWELGAGKTHFVKGFIEWLGLDPYKVQSPTYTYFHDYEGKVLHVDMYRLENEQYFIQKWMLQQIQDYDYVLIERPKYTHLYADRYTSISIEKISETEREVKIA